MVRLYLDAGRQHGVRPADVVGAFTAEAGVPGSSIGTIDMFGDFSLVEVERRAAAILLERALLLLRGREVHITPAREKRETERKAPPRGAKKGAQKRRQPAKA